MVRESASHSVDLGLVFQVESYQKTLKIGIHSFSAGAQLLRNDMENKPASLLIVSFGKTFNGMPTFLCGRQVASRKWQLPSKGRHSIQKTATQFAFSGMEDKHGQYKYKKDVKFVLYIKCLKTSSVKKIL